MSESKTLLIGLDAACMAYLDPLLGAGKLPNLKNLIERGSYGKLLSVMPPITPAAWSSIITGVNPGKHGVYEWVKRRSDGYGLAPVDGSQRIGTTVWQRLNEAGIRVGVVNIPLTYPVQSIDGFLLCGFSTPGSRRDLSWPQEALSHVENEFGVYKPDIDKGGAEVDSPEMYRAEQDFQRRQVRITASLANRYEVQVLITNLMLLDHANHTMPDMSTVEEAIIESDRDLGYLLDEFQPDNVMVISDHGSRRVRGVFLLSGWLADHDYLKLERRSSSERSATMNYLLMQWKYPGEKVQSKTARWILRNGLLKLPGGMTSNVMNELKREIPLARLQLKFTNRIDPAGSRVYLPAGHRGNISLNREGREPSGIVSASEADQLLGEIREKLLAIKDPMTSETVFDDIYTPNEIYTGPYMDAAPDLTGDYYSSGWSVRTKLPGLTRRPWRYFLTGERWYGDHSSDGIYVFAGSEFKKISERGEANLLDIPATLLYLHGVAQPDDYDGYPLQDLMIPAMAEHQLRYQPGDARESISNDVQTIGDDQALLQRLHDLGYLDVDEE